MYGWYGPGRQVSHPVVSSYKLFIASCGNAVKLRCTLLEKAKKQRMQRNRVTDEYEAMLNSSPGKGIIDTGCAKMMMGSDTFKQYLDLLSSEKNRFRFGDNETRMSHWSAFIESTCVARKWRLSWVMLRF